MIFQFQGSNEMITDDEVEATNSSSTSAAVRSDGPELGNVVVKMEATEEEISAVIDESSPEDLQVKMEEIFN